MFQPKTLDFSKIKTFSAQNRQNLVRIDNLRTPGAQEDNLFHSEEFDTLVAKLKEARQHNRTAQCWKEILLKEIPRNEIPGIFSGFHKHLRFGR